MALKILNLSLLILFPVAWFSPLLKAGLGLPLFGLEEVSILSGLQALWGSDVYLALLVTFFALFAPYVKTIGLALLHFNLHKLPRPIIERVLTESSPVHTLAIVVSVILLCVPFYWLFERPFLSIRQNRAGATIARV